MKKWKQLLTVTLASLTVVGSLGTAGTINAEAAVPQKDKVLGDVYTDPEQKETTGDWVSTTKYATTVGDSVSINVQGALVSSVKASKSGVKVAVTSTSREDNASWYSFYYDETAYDAEEPVSPDWADYDSYDAYKAAYDVYEAKHEAWDLKNDYVESTVSVYAKKAGTYTITLSGVDRVGTPVSTSVKVLVRKNGYRWSSVKFNGTKIASASTKVKKDNVTTTSLDMLSVDVKGIPVRGALTFANKGKVKVSANSNYKVTGLLVGTVNANGKLSWKKVKNGKSITLSKGTLKSDNLDATSGKYEYAGTTKLTFVCVSYKDKFTGDTHTYSYDKARKAVKEVVVDGTTKVKTTNYHPSGEAGFYYSDFALVQQ